MAKLMPSSQALTAGPTPLAGEGDFTDLMIGDEADSDFDAIEEDGSGPRAPEPAVDCSLQRDIALGRSISDCFDVDFLAHVPQALQAALRGRMTPCQISRILPCLRSVSQGVLILLGFAGSGKTTFLALIMLMLVGAGKTISVTSPTNVAASNIARRTGSLDTNERLLIRVFTAYIEIYTVLRYDPRQPHAWKDTPTGRWYGHNHWEPKYSIAEWMLKLVGFLPTTNQKIIGLRDGHGEIIKILRTLPEERTDDDLSVSRILIRRAMRDICEKADIIFSTTTRSWDVPLVRKFTKNSDVVGLEEAGCAVPSELYIPWRGNKYLLMAGDPNQLPPTCLSEKVSVGGRNVNPLAENQTYSPLTRLKELGFPCIVLSEQLRMVPGGFDLAEAIIYSGWNVTISSVFTNHILAPALEMYALSLHDSIEPSLHAHLWPVHINIRGSRCVTGPTESKSNGRSARYTIRLVREMLTRVAGLSQDDIVIITPYRDQGLAWTYL
ncbi:hypothetical protein BP6252_07797 [Coleophoma cylindrospora]|uniref:DNA2/NAM7 helicase helicase domain-containing protein n=1 Tax=Coleophoma cylindrospora TaxID=1849047 RepID=A0A3D8RBJ4_9HELO|nr:hypothetical protein BP6252_07797 [Coleophoma cylindrospora]